MTSEIPISDITITSWNPRKVFNEDELQELEASIEEYGILEPLIVRPVDDMNGGDVLLAIVRIVCSDMLNCYDSVDLDMLKKYVPAATKFYVPPEESE